MKSNPTDKNASAQARDEKIIRLLGLAARAGRLVVGAEKVVDAVRAGLVSRREGIIVVAAGAAERTKKNLAFAAEEDGIEIIELQVDMYEFGRQVGGKGPTAAVAVLDRNMAAGIKNSAGERI